MTLLELIEAHGSVYGSEVSDHPDGRFVAIRKDDYEGIVAVGDDVEVCCAQLADEVLHGFDPIGIFDLKHNEMLELGVDIEVTLLSGVPS